MPVSAVADSGTAHAAVRAELDGAGWADQLREFTVTTAAGAAPVVATALAGVSVLVLAVAGAAVFDDLIEDLSRIGRVVVASDETAVRLPADTWRLLHLLAGGTTLAAAAQREHVSLRTANRRLDEAKLAFGVGSRGEVVQRLAGRDRVPRAPG